MSYYSLLYLSRPSENTLRTSWGNMEIGMRWLPIDYDFYHQNRPC